MSDYLYQYYYFTNQFLGITVEYMERRDIHLCGGHSHPHLPLIELNYQSRQLHFCTVYYLVIVISLYTFITVIGLF